VQGITQEYFSILDNYFGECFKIAKRDNFVRDSYWKKINGVYDPITINSLMDSLYEDLSKINWSFQENSIQNSCGLKVAYSGSVFGYSQEISQITSFLKKTALYADNILMNDNIYSELWSWKKKGQLGFEISFSLICFNAIDLLCLKDFFISDSEIPVCTLTPPMMWKFNERHLETTIDESLYQSEVTKANQFFGKDFSSRKELQKFLGQFDNPKDFFINSKKPFLLQGPNGKPLGAKDFFQIRQNFETKYSRSFTNTEIYESLLRSNLSMAIYDLTYNANLDCAFGTDYRGVWNSLNWIMKNTCILPSSTKKIASKDSAVLHAIQEDEFKWLGNVPLDRIKEIRERGELRELRDVLAENIETVEEAEDTEFSEVSLQVRYNLTNAFKRHSAEIQDLNRLYRDKFKLSTSSIVVSGALGISAFLYPPLAIVATIVGGASLNSIRENFFEKREKMKELRRKPVAMLFDAHA
jgi:hypothetical protein